MGKQVVTFSKRCLTLVLGLLVIAFGVAISTQANLGTSPVSCLPYAVSNILPFTVGNLTVALHLCLIALQIILLRKNYKPIQLTQVLIAFVLGWFIDFAMLIVSHLQISGYVMQWVFCLISCVLVAFGVFLEVKANLVVLAAEGLAKALSQVTGKDFGKMKIAVDVSMVAIAILVSMVFLGHLVGVREGTLAAAILVGAIVRVFNRHGAWLDRLLATDSSKEVAASSSEGPASVQ